MDDEVLPPETEDTPALPPLPAACVCHKCGAVAPCGRMANIDGRWRCAACLRKT